MDGNEALLRDCLEQLRRDSYSETLPFIVTTRISRDAILIPDVDVKGVPGLVRNQQEGAQSAGAIK